MNRNAQIARKAAGERTRSLILDVAERICAEKGFEALSMRTISEAANVNLGAVTYHFGGKNGLFEALFRRRVVPLNDERLEMLDAALSQAGGPTLEDVIRAFVQPPMRLSAPEQYATGNPAIVVMQFLSRAFSMPGESQFLETYYEPVRSRFTLALKHLLPDVPLETVIWGYNLLVGAIIYAMGGPERMERRPDLFSTTPVHFQNDLDVVVERFVQFFGAGFRAYQKPVGLDLDAKGA